MDTQKQKDIIVSGNTFAAFLHTKAESLAKALYLITNLFEHEEPLRLELRESAVSLVKETLRISDSSDLSLRQKEIVSQIRATHSLVGVGKESGLISDMNGTLLKQELEGLLNHVDTHKEKKAHLSEDFFKTTFLPTSVSKPEGDGVAGPQVSQQEKIQKDISKGHSPVSSFTQTSVPTKANNSETAQERRNTVIEIIKKQGQVSIRDLRMKIDGCSEKTLQRDLQALEQKGTVKHTGERRWTRYSLV